MTTIFNCSLDLQFKKVLQMYSIFCSKVALFLAMAALGKLSFLQQCVQYLPDNSQMEIETPFFGKDHFSKRVDGLPLSRRHFGQQFRHIFPVVTLLAHLNLARQSLYSDFWIRNQHLSLWRLTDLQQFYSDNRAAGRFRPLI